MRASASYIWLIYDADDASPFASGSIEDYPDATDNHVTDGGNVAFADGHAEFVKRDKYIKSFALETDKAHAPPPPSLQ